MSLVAVVKGLGPGDWLRLPVYIPIMVTSLSLSLSVSLTHTHTLTLVRFLPLNHSPLQGRWRAPFAIQ